MFEVGLTRRSLLRNAARIAAAVSISTLLPGCASKTPAPAEAPKEAATAAPAAKDAATTVPTAASGAPVTDRIEIRTMARAGFAGDGHREFAKRFMDLHPNVVVKMEDVTYNDIFQKTLALAAVGDLQDLIFGHSRWSPYCAYKGLFADLDPMVQADGEAVLDIYYPSLIEDMRGAGSDGKLFYLPEFMDVAPNAGIYFNLTLLGEAGFQAPTSDDWTFDDLEEMARGVAKPDEGIYGIIDNVLIAKEAGLQAWTRGWGAPGDEASWALSGDGKTIRLADEYAIVKESLDWWWRLARDRVVATSDTIATVEGGADSMFANGQVAIRIDDSSATIDLVESVGDKFEWAAAIKPLGPKGNRGSAVESGRWSVSANSKYPQEAYELCKLHTSYDSAIWAVLNLKRSPHSVKAAWTDPRVLEINPMWGKVNTWLEKGADPYPMPTNLRGIEFRDAITNELGEWYDGKETWEEMIAHAQPAIQEVLDLPMP